MSLPNPILSFSVGDQVRPSDSQYRDYKRSGDSFWSKLDSVKLDTGKLEHLFESKSKEMPVTKVNNQYLNTGRQRFMIKSGIYDLTNPVINHNGL